MEIASIDDAYSLLYSQLIKKNNKSKQLLEKSGADYIINTLDELPNVINDINRRNLYYINTHTRLNKRIIL